jgi:hypothetical protein
MATIGAPTTGNAFADPSLRPRRVIPDGRGGSFSTQLTDEELAAVNRGWEARRTEALRSAMATLPQTIEKQRREQYLTAVHAILEAPEPRQRLRQAHAEKAAAETEVARLEGVREAARGHLAAMEGEFGAAVKEQRRYDAEAAQALAAALANGAAAEPAALSQSSSRVDDARRRRDQARSAIDIIQDQLKTAEATVRSCRTAVEKSAEQVAVRAWLVLGDRLAALDTERAELIEQRYSLSVALTPAGRLERTRLGTVLKELIEDAEAAVPV